MFHFGTDIRRVSLAFLSVVALTLPLISQGSPQPTFEGYYKYTDGNNQHIGYSIVRNEFDSKKKEHSLRAYLRIQVGDTQIQESRVLKSSENLSPTSMEYRLITPQGARTIDARFSSGKMTGQLTVSGEEKSFEQNIPPGAFFSGALLQWLMGIGADAKDPRGLAAGRTYQFQAIDEETGQVHPGQVQIPEETQLMGRTAYKVLFTYLNQTHVSYVDKFGEVLKVEAPESGIQATLMTNPSEATGAFAVPQAIIEQVFGSRPLGKLNRLSSSQGSQNQGS